MGLESVIAGWYILSYSAGLPGPASHHLPEPPAHSPTHTGLFARRSHRSTGSVLEATVLVIPFARCALPSSMPTCRSFISFNLHPHVHFLASCFSVLPIY